MSPSNYHLRLSLDSHPIILSTYEAENQIVMLKIKSWSSWKKQKTGVKGGENASGGISGFQLPVSGL